MSEGPLFTSWCSTQVHVAEAGGLRCEERGTGEEVKCQRLVPLTLLKQSVIHKTTPSTPSPTLSMRGVYRLPLQADLPPSAALCSSPRGLRGPRPIAPR